MGGCGASTVGVAKSPLLHCAASLPIPAVVGMEAQQWGAEAGLRLERDLPSPGVGAVRCPFSCMAERLGLDGDRLIAMGWQCISDLLQRGKLQPLPPPAASEGRPQPQAHPWSYLER